MQPVNYGDRISTQDRQEIDLTYNYNLNYFQDEEMPKNLIFALKTAGFQLTKQGDFNLLCNSG